MNSAASDVRGAVLWITGLPGSGKTTVSLDVKKILENDYRSVVWLDGEDLRKVYRVHGGFDSASRLEIGRMTLRLCSLISSSGHIVLLSAVGLFGELHDAARDSGSVWHIVNLEARREVRTSRTARLGKEVYRNSSDVEGVFDTGLRFDDSYTNNGGMPPRAIARMIASNFVERLESEGLSLKKSAIPGIPGVPAQ